MSRLKAVAGAVARIMSAVTFGLLAVPVLYLLEPFLRIRVGHLWETRIGHLAQNTDLFLRGLSLRGRPSRTVYIVLTAAPCNRTLLTLIKRHPAIITIESRILRSLSYGVFPWLARTRFFLPLWADSNEHEEFASVEPQLAFTEEENSAGRAFLAGLGIGPDDWFVCFHARDPAYLLACNHGRDTDSTERVYAMRDCSVENYLPAAEWIASQGGFAIRMGAVVDRPLPDGLHPRIIDYASRHRSDFLDIWLCANCRYYLGSDSGLAQIPLIFNKIIGVANFVPYCDIPVGSFSWFVPKLLEETATGLKVPFGRLCEEGYFHIEQRGVGSDLERRGEAHYHARGLRWLESLPEDILDLCRDIHERSAGIQPPPEAVALQENYLEYFRGNLNYTPHASRIGPRFALKYRELITPAPPYRPGTASRPSEQQGSSHGLH